MVGVVVASEDLRSCRDVARALLRRGQRQLHMAKESRQRREQILDEIRRLPVELVVATSSLTSAVARTARAQVVATLADALIDRAVETWTLDSIDHEEVRRDREAIARRLAAADAPDSMTYRHQDSHQEPMLWIADGAA